jgi:hypothetical protein
MDPLMKLNYWVDDQRHRKTIDGKPLILKKI